MDAVIRAGGRSCIRGRLPSLARSLYPLPVLPQALHDRRSLQPRHLKRRRYFGPTLRRTSSNTSSFQKDGTTAFGRMGMARSWTPRSAIRLPAANHLPPRTSTHWHPQDPRIPARSRPLRQRLRGRRCRYLDRADPTGDHAGSTATRSAQAAPRGFDHGDRTDQSRLPRPAPCESHRTAQGDPGSDSGRCATDF